MKKGMNRRDFLKKSGYGLLGVTAISLGKGAPASDKPNILLIITDQQFADAMSCRVGNQHINTPAMDSLAGAGTAYTRAYCANPVCVPSRSSMFTGYYPPETGVLSHEVKELDFHRFPCMGKIFRDAGYETGYVGKWHIPIPLANVDASGFEYSANIRTNGADLKNSEAAIDFVRQKRHKPFLLVASYNNPHNICEWARGTRGNKLPDGNIGTPPAMDECPPLPANHQPGENEPDIVTLLRKSYHASRFFPVGQFGEKEWREYIWAYYRMIEMVDKRIGKLLDGLRESGQEDNTVIVFTSDHGDCHSAHKWNQKTMFYDEAARVPFIIAYKGHTSATISDRLVQTGVDLIPTLCDYAGIPIPKGLPGLSMKADNNKEAREYIVCQNQFLQGASVDGRIPKPTGRMIRSDRFKYCLYSEGEQRESLIDMASDPAEMVNQAGNPAFKKTLEQHRAFLREFAKKHNDADALKMLNPVG